MYSFPSEKCPTSWNAAPWVPPALRREGKGAGQLLSKTGKIFTSFSLCSVLQEPICSVTSDGESQKTNSSTHSVGSGSAFWDQLPCPCSIPQLPRGHSHFACWCRFCLSWLSSGVCSLTMFGFQPLLSCVICSGGLCVIRPGGCCPKVFPVLQGRRFYS